MEGRLYSSDYIGCEECGLGGKKIVEKDGKRYCWGCYEKIRNPTMGQDSQMEKCLEGEEGGERYLEDGALVFYYSHGKTTYIGRERR